MFCFVVSFNLDMFGSCVRMLAVILVLDLFLTSRAEHHHIYNYTEACLKSLPESLISLKFNFKLS